MIGLDNFLMGQKFCKLLFCGFIFPESWCGKKGPKCGMVMGILHQIICQDAYGDKHPIVRSPPVISNATLL